MVSSVMPYEKRYADVNGVRMAYVEAGTGDPIVLLHGNPTSSYLWRNVVPHLEPLGRCIAPDLVGMGDSAKLGGSGDGRYRYVVHRHYLDGLLETLGVHDRVVFVVHDWGSALGFDWAFRHPDAVQGIAYLEAIIRPLTWDDWPEDAREIFQAMRSSAGEEMVLDNNVFVEQVLPSAILRDDISEEMEVYRAPYREPGEDRRPTLDWPRELPIEGKPSDVERIVSGYADWLAASSLPKLLVTGDPGMILTGAQLEFARGWPGQREVTVPGLHFLQEDSPDQLGSAVASWCREALGRA